MSKEELLTKKKQLLKELEKVNQELGSKDTILPETFYDGLTDDERPFTDEETLIYLDYIAAADSYKVDSIYNTSVDCFFEKDGLKVRASFSCYRFEISFSVDYLNQEFEFDCDDIDWAKELLNKILSFKEVKLELPETITVPELFVEYWKNECIYIGDIQSILDLTYENGVLKKSQNEEPA